MCIFKHLNEEHWLCLHTHTSKLVERVTATWKKNPDPTMERSFKTCHIINALIDMEDGIVGKCRHWWPSSAKGLRRAWLWMRNSIYGPVCLTRAIDYTEHFQVNIKCLVMKHCGMICQSLLQRHTKNGTSYN